jgi:hypothetical protein
MHHRQNPLESSDNYVMGNIIFHALFVSCGYETLCPTNLCNGFATCPSWLEGAGYRVPVTNLTDFNVFYTSLSQHKLNVVLFSAPYP